MAETQAAASRIPPRERADRGKQQSLRRERGVIVLYACFVSESGFVPSIIPGILLALEDLRGKVTTPTDHCSISHTKVPELLGHGTCPNYIALEGDGRHAQHPTARYCYPLTQLMDGFTIPHLPCCCRCTCYNPVERATRIYK